MKSMVQAAEVAVHLCDVYGLRATDGMDGGEDDSEKQKKILDGGIRGFNGGLMVV